MELNKSKQSDSNSQSTSARNSQVDRKAFLSKINGVQSQYSEVEPQESNNNGEYNPYADQKNMSSRKQQKDWYDSVFDSVCEILSLSNIMHTLFLPVILVLRLVVPKDVIYGTIQQFNDSMAYMWRNVLQPAKMGKFGLRCIFNFAVLVFALSSAASFSFVQYGSFYYYVIPKTDIVTDIQFMPIGLADTGFQTPMIAPTATTDDSLVSTIRFKPRSKKQNQFDIQQMPTSNTWVEETAPIELADEVYKMMLEIEVPETEHNMKQGNLYLTTQINSCDLNKMNRVLKRMGTIESKGQVNQYMSRWLTNWIPFSQRLMSFFGVSSKKIEKNSQIVQIPIAKDIDNLDYPLCRIDLQLANKQLQFKNAQLRFSSILSPYSLTNGYRYFMREWFWTTLILVTSCLTFMNFTVLFFVLFLLGLVPCLQKTKSKRV